MFFPHFVGELFGHAGISWAVRIGTFKELKSFSWREESIPCGTYR
jgi:hypothetical protein